MQEVIEELQQSGALDPAAQKKLMADLRQTDPALWPLVLQQFRAAVAYRRRAEGREMATAGPGRSAPTQSVADPIRLGGPFDRHAGQSVPRQAYLPQGVPPPIGHSSERLERLPAANDAALAPRDGPQGNYPSTAYASGNARPANRPPGVRQTSEPAGEVISTSYDSGAARDWRAQLATATRTLESQLQGAPSTPGQVARHAQLRMLYLLAGRRDDAVRAIPSTAPAVQEFWSKQLYALATWLDTERTPDATGRAAETKRILDEAVTRLGESAPLLVRNLAFCTEVHSYGCTKQFKKYEFAPEQELLLYAEVDNFTSEPTPKGFHTSLRSSYQIFDSRGQRVADHQFKTTEEYCRNHRRDFFIGYHLRLPKRIYAGKHTLQLTIQDLKSQKVGQSSIELTIRDTDD